MADIIQFDSVEKKVRAYEEEQQIKRMQELLYQMRDLMMLYCIQAMELIDQVPERRE